MGKIFNIKRLNQDCYKK